MLPFLVKSLICGSFLYTLYYLLLRKETFFQLNRCYLLASLFLCFIIPIIHIPIHLTTPIDESPFFFLLDKTKEFFFIYLLDEVVIYGKASPFTWQNILEKAYLIGIFVCSLRILIFLFKIIKLNHNSKKYRLQNIDLYIHKEPYTAFSFLNKIYCTKEDFNSPNFKMVWKHEIQHIKYGHTFESFLLEIWCCIFWFNPFVWKIKKELKNIHEYQTDNSLVEQGINSITYQQYLIKYTLQGNISIATDSFKGSLIKDRILMLGRKKSSLWKKTKIAIALPVLMLLTLLLTTEFILSPQSNSIKQIPKENSQDSITNIIK